LKKIFFTLENILIISGLLIVVLLLFLYYLVPNLLNIFIVRILVVILIIAVIVYFKAKDLIRIRDQKSYSKDKEMGRKRKEVLRRDKPFISKAIGNRDLEFLWQKSLEYDQEVYLWDKAEELWIRIKTLDPNGYYGKKAEEKLRPASDSKAAVDAVNKISLFGKSKKRGQT